MHSRMKDSCVNAKKKSRQRLGGGGGGLTLPAFVNAKSKPRFNPADFRKKRQQYENAKKIKKYKRLVTRLPHQDQNASIEEFSGTEGKLTSVSTSNGSAFEQKFARKERHGKNVLEALREDYVKRKEEEDRLKAERLEAFKAKEEATSRSLQIRKNLKAKMLKRTNSGQPLMKHRLQHMLESIESSGL